MIARRRQRRACARAHARSSALACTALLSRAAARPFFAPATLPARVELPVRGSTESALPQPRWGRLWPRGSCMCAVQPPHRSRLIRSPRAPAGRAGSWREPAALSRPAERCVPAQRARGMRLRRPPRLPPPRPRESGTPPRTHNAAELTRRCRRSAHSGSAARDWGNFRGARLSCAAPLSRLCSARVSRPLGWASQTCQRCGCWLGCC